MLVLLQAAFAGETGHRSGALPHAPFRQETTRAAAGGQAAAAAGGGFAADVAGDPQPAAPKVKGKFNSSASRFRKASGRRPAA